MPIGPPKPIPIPFPIKGLDQGAPAILQPDLTTADLRNVRALHRGDRVGGGKRPGSSKAFTPQLGTGSLGHRVTGLAGFAEGAAVPTFGSGGELDVTDDYTTLSSGAFPSLTGDYLVPFAKFSGANRLSGLGLLGEAQTAGLPSTALAIGAADTDLHQHVTAMIRYATTNSMKATFIAKPYFATGSTTHDSAHHLGVCCAVSNDGKSGIALVLVRDGSDTQCTVELWELEANASTLIDSAGPLTVSGAATGWLSDLVMQLTVVGDVVTGTVHWDSEKGTDAGWDPATPTVVTGDLASDFTDTGLSGYVRSGFGFFEEQSTANAEHRFVKQAEFTALVPAAPAAVFSMRPTDESSGSSNFLVPEGVRSVQIDLVGNDLDGDITGEQSSGTLTGDFAQVPVIDQSGNHLEFQKDTGAQSIVALTDEPADGVKLGMVQSMISGDFRAATFCTRVSDDFESCICVAAGSAEPNGDFQAMGALDYATLTFTYISAATSIFSPSAGNSTDRFPPFRIDDLVVWQDTGTAITCTVNGMEIITHTINTTHAATVGDTARTGFCIDGFNGGSAIVAGGGYWISVATGETVNIADIDTRLVAFTRDKAYTGKLDTPDVLQELTGQALSNPLVQGAAFAGLIYAVDGSRAKILNVATLTISDWASAVTAGTLPSGARLVALYRGALYLARFSGDPKAWSKSRTLDPLDWDVNAEPLATSAYDHTVGQIGKPEDDITALIPHLDDFLIFGCGTSLWYMEGDPGFRGQIINLSRQTGIVGARAFAWDSDDRLYFLGQAGLYGIKSMPGRPQPISSKKLKTLLDRVDLDNTLVQMGYNDFRKEIHIYLTPVDESAGVHAVYDVEADAFWLDDFPARFGPTAVMSVTGVIDQRRNVLMGGWDGYLRWLDDQQFDDDGDAITAYFDSAPLQPFGNQVESRAMELQGELYDESGEVTWEWYTADSADEVRRLSGSPADTGTWGGNDSAGNPDAGFQEPVGLSERGGAHKLRLSQTSAAAGFSLEAMTAVLEPSSRRR